MRLRGEPDLSGLRTALRIELCGEWIKFNPETAPCPAMTSRSRPSARSFTTQGRLTCRLTRTCFVFWSMLLQRFTMSAAGLSDGVCLASGRPWAAGFWGQRVIASLGRFGSLLFPSDLDMESSTATRPNTRTAVPCFDQPVRPFVRRWKGPASSYARSSEGWKPSSASSAIPPLAGRER